MHNLVAAMQGTDPSMVLPQVARNTIPPHVLCNATVKGRNKKVKGRMEYTAWYMVFQGKLNFYCA
jgi:hypothetical protein